MSWKGKKKTISLAVENFPLSPGSRPALTAVNLRRVSPQEFSNSRVWVLPTWLPALKKKGLFTAQWFSKTPNFRQKEHEQLLQVKSTWRRDLLQDRSTWALCALLDQPREQGLLGVSSVKSPLKAPPGSHLALGSCSCSRCALLTGKVLQPPGATS